MANSQRRSGAFRVLAFGFSWIRYFQRNQHKSLVQFGWASFTKHIEVQQTGTQSLLADKAQTILQMKNVTWVAKGFRD